MVPGEGVWTVDPATGAITFTPEATFVGNPTPISYTAANDAGGPGEAATVTVTYTAPVVPVTLAFTGSSPVPAMAGVMFVVVGWMLLSVASRREQSA